MNMLHSILPKPSQGYEAMTKATQIQTQAPPRFVRAYIDTLLWSTFDDDGEPFEDTYGITDLAPESLAKIVADCGRFLAEVESAGIDLEQGLLVDRDPAEHAGFHFWLTRNGHGAGFWGGDWTQEVGKRLTTIAKAFGEVWPHIGDDGRVYI